MEVPSPETKPKQRTSPYTGQRRKKEEGGNHILGTTKLSPYLDFEVTFAPSGLPYSTATTNRELSNGSNREEKQHQ